MPRKEGRERVERGLYRSGRTYFACATAEGGRQAIWKTLGDVNLMDARRLRDEFVVGVRKSETPVRKPRVTFAEASAEWMKTQEQRVAVGDLRQRTLDIYEQGLRLHVLPELGNRQVKSITPDDLVAWHRRRQAEGYRADSIHAWWSHFGWCSPTRCATTCFRRIPPTSSSRTSARRRISPAVAF